jgi:hypothetical protein
MAPLIALVYSFFFGLLHGILPDEHTWPITFSYAIGGASGKEGLKAGFYFSAAFTLQRTLLSEAAYLALAPFLLRPTINGIVYLVVGVAMSVAGAIVLRQNRYVHIHLLGHCHDEATDMECSKRLLGREHTAPNMGSPWLGFLPGLLFGVGTMIMLLMIGFVFGVSLRWTHRLTEEEIRRIGSQTGGRTLFFGGLLFGVFGVVTLLGLDRNLPLDAGYVLIGLFMIIVAVPAFIFSWREVRSAGTKPRPEDEERNTQLSADTGKVKR